MLRRIVFYLLMLCLVFAIICIISVIQHWDYISQNLFDSIGVALSSCGILIIIGVGLFTMLKSLRR